MEKENSLRKPMIRNPYRENFWFDDFLKDFSVPKMPLTDVVEKEDSFEFHMEMPGYTKEEIEISLHNGILKIVANKKETTEEKDEGKVVFSERRFGHTERSFQLPEGVMEEDIKAELKDGMLTLKVPKKEPVEIKQKKIEIQ